MARTGIQGHYVDALGRRNVAVDFALNDDGLGEHLGLDLSVGPDRQDVLSKLDLAFDLSFDRQIFASAQLALDDDALPDIHHVPL